MWQWLSQSAMLTKKGILYNFRFVRIFRSVMRTRFTKHKTRFGFFFYQNKIYFLDQIIGAFCLVQNMSEENMDFIIRQTKGYASSFLRKKDSCLMLLKASHLYHSRKDNVTFWFVNYLGK